MKSGFVSIIGRPNVGKSTFLNTVIGKKIAITSAKPQTTRNTIAGVLTTEDYQIIFTDTPGIHKPINELGKRMTDSAYKSIKGVDAIIFMTPLNEELSTGDKMIIDNLKMTKTPVFLVINKIDLQKNKDDLEKKINQYSGLLDFKGIYPISALNNLKVDELINGLVESLEEGPQYYPSDMVTDHPERFLIGELIREKVLLLTKEEVPHSVAVTIESLKRNEEGLLECYANIYVERDSQKGILIGSKGSMLKQIGSLARKEINNILGEHIYLELWVKVKPDWRNSNVTLKALGYDVDNF